MIVSETVLDRLIASDAACVSDRLGVIASRAGNPFAAAIHHDGEVHGFRCAVIPTPGFNRVIGLSDALADRAAKATTWLREAGRHGSVEVLPHRHGPALARALAALGFGQTGFDMLLGAEPDDAEPPTSVNIETVATAAAMDLFLDTHLAGWEIPAKHHASAKDNMRNWLGLPGWTMLLARIDGEPAGTAVLHVAEGIAYCADAATHPSWRGRGVQSALLRRRRHLAAAACCGMVWSRTTPFSGSERNLLRAGFSRLCNIAIWQYDVP